MICHNGDFFTQTNNGYQRSSKQDDRNTLFKGVTQLNAAIEPVLKVHSGKNLELFLTIVTNAQIHVAKFDLKRALDQQVSTAEIPWAAYTNPLVSSRRFDWEAVGGSDAAKYAEQKRFPVVWIVNFEYLEEFVSW